MESIQATNSPNAPLFEASSRSAELPLITDLAAVTPHWAAVPQLKPSELAVALTEQHGRFILRSDGVFEDSAARSTPRFVCSPLIIRGETRDERSENWGRLLHWADGDSKVHEWSVPAELILQEGTDLVQVLVQGGLQVGAGSSALVKEYIQTVKSPAKIRCVSKTGWHRFGNAESGQHYVFVLPGEILGQVPGEQIVLQQPAYLGTASTSVGDLASWQRDVASLAVGNSRMVFAISLGFAAPLASLLGIDSAGFHFHGASSSGKSKSLAAAASVWGYPVERWRTTDNALEATAERHNDLVLCIDELAELDARKASQVVYMFGNGESKGRMNANTSLQAKKKWNLLFLSTGELTMAEHAQTVGKNIKAGAEVRMVNIDADAGAGMGMFEEIHGQRSPAQFAELVNKVVKENQGTAGPAFIRHLIANMDADLQTAKNMIGQFVAEHLPPNSSGEIARVVRLFALVAAGGKFATAAGITGWDLAEPENAAKRCLASWLSSRSLGSSDMEKALAQVRQFISAFGDSRFQNLDARMDHEFSRVIQNRAGFRQSTNATLDQSSQTTFYFLQETFVREVCLGHDAKRVAKELRSGGHLIHSANRLMLLKRIPELSERAVYVYAIKDSILAEDELSESKGRIEHSA